MKKILLIILIISFAGAAQAQNTDNPGYFRSPGFLGIAGGTVYHHGNTSRGDEIQPFALAMINLVQSEYGNLALSIGSLYSAPYTRPKHGDIKYTIDAQQVTGEFGLNYITGSKTINFWLGAGYNVSFVNSKLKGVKNTSTGARSSFSKSYSQTVSGWHYYIGGEYVLTKSGKWGIFVLLRGQEADRAKHKIGNVTFSDGSSAFLNTRNMSMSNKSYMLGLTYHF